MTLRRELSDALDASLEMPEQYGSRGYWRYQQITSLVGLISIPILIGLYFLDTSAGLGRIALIVGLLAIAGVAIFLVRRDIQVQRRIDDTGSPLADREPY